MASNYLLIDYGNSYIKAAVYDGYQQEIIEVRQCEKTINPRELLSKFRYLGDRHPTKVLESVTSIAEYATPFNLQLSKILKTNDIYVLTRNDFEDVMDLSNVDENVFIGSDILTLGYYGLKTLKEGLVVSLGTAYFALVLKDKQIKNTYLLPSISKGIEAIAHLTTIPRDYLPEMYDQELGVNTSTAFSAGANLCIEGFIDKVVENYKLKPEQVIITGGDCFRYGNIKKYKEKNNLVLYGMAELIKDKKW